jgi:hypothetical protein
MTLTKRTSLNVTILGHRVLASYDGQPLTCYVVEKLGTFTRYALSDEEVVEQWKTRQPRYGPPLRRATSDE